MNLPAIPHIGKLGSYEPGRPIEEVARELGLDPNEVIKLASNENALGPSPKAVQAIQKALPNLHLYPDGGAYYLKNGVAKHLGVQPENLVFGTGSNEIIEFLGHVFLGPGDEIVVSQYCFAIYPLIASMMQSKTITVPAINYGHDLNAMAKAVTPRTKLIFIANPNNPTGTKNSNEEIYQLMESIPSSCVVVIDEAYVEFLDQPPDLLRYVREGRNVVLMRTFSKIMGLAGLRIGYGIASTEIVTLINKVRQPFNTNVLAQIGALAGLEDQEHQHKTRELTRAGLGYLESLCKELNLSYVPSYANFLLIKVGQGSHVFRELQKLGVIVRPMDGYQLPEFIRVTVGTPEQNEKFAKALKNVLAAQKGA